MKYTAPRIEKVVQENELALEAAYAADTSMAGEPLRERAPLQVTSYSL